LAITPSGDFSISSESKKSYLLTAESSFVNKSPKDNTFFPKIDLPPKVSK
jgi:hypothetical protein